MAAMLILATVPSVALILPQDTTNEEPCTLTCLRTTASGGISNAFGMLATANGSVSTAMGYNTTAGGDSSIAMGVSTRTFSDPNVPGGSSCGGCISTGFSTTTIGDWATAMGSGSTARGYASTALGDGTLANTWGEVALGLFTQTEPEHTEEELRNASVIPAFDERDVVLRVGIGCTQAVPGGGVGCTTPRRLDALRVYKSGALFLQNSDGQIVPDVQAALELCSAENKATKRELGKIKRALEELEARLARLEKE